MKNLINAAVALIFAASVAPVSAFAQGSGSVTRAQVHARLIALEKAGYNPYNNAWLYPNDLKQAEATVAENDATRMAERSRDQSPEASATQNATHAVTVNASNADMPSARYALSAN